MKNKKINEKLDQLLVCIQYDQYTFCDNLHIATIQQSEIRKTNQYIRQYYLNEYFLELKKLGVRKE
jgi:hypothetical protein